MRSMTLKPPVTAARPPGVDADVAAWPPLSWPPACTAAALFVDPPPPPKKLFNEMLLRDKRFVSNGGGAAIPSTHFNWADTRRCRFPAASAFFFRRSDRFFASAA